VKVFNLHGDEWDDAEEREGWRSRDARAATHIGAELLGGTLYELDPGNRLFPYHLHHANEEWLIVVRGRPTLRSPDGEQDLDEGDVVCFPRGPSGAHQLTNNTDSPLRVLMLSSRLWPEIVEYPDSEKVGTRDANGERLFLGRQGPMLDYWDGES
jgi:uncharacterized cupin superfamily protein